MTLIARYTDRFNTGFHGSVKREKRMFQCVGDSNAFKGIQGEAFVQQIGETRYKATVI